MLPRLDRFESLPAWRHARALTAAVYAVTEVAGFGRDWALREAARQAALRALEAVTELALPAAPLLREHRGLAALTALAALRSLFYVALDQGYVGQEEIDRLALDVAWLERELTRVAGRPAGWEAASAAEGLD